MVTIKDGCGCDPCDCDWKQKLKVAYSRAIQSVNKIGDETGRVYFPDGTGFVKVPLPTKKQIDSIAEIDGIKASVDELNVTVPALETQVTGVTGSLVSNVEVLNGTTAGKFKVRIEREKAALIDSNDYDLSKVNSIELIQGSGPAMVKAQLTLSDGTVLRSDDFLFTTESIGTDVYISSFTFKAGNVDGTISADIGLNNGVTIEANNFVVPTDPGVISNITDLQNRVTNIENTSVTDIEAIKNELNNKADVDNTNQTIRTGTIKVYTFNLPTGTPSAVNPDSCAIGINESEAGKLDTNKPLKAIRSYYDDFAGDYTSEPLGNIALLNDDGSPKNFTGGGEVWEEVDLSNFPTDWVDGDRIKVVTKYIADTNNSLYVNSQWGNILEFEIGSGYSDLAIYKIGTNTNNKMVFYALGIGRFYEFNGSGAPIILRAFTNDNYSGYNHSEIPINKLGDGNTKMWRLKK